MIIFIALMGLISNGIRGRGIKIYFTDKIYINQDHINAYIFGLVFMQKWYEIFPLFLGMFGGMATGWTAFIKGVRGEFSFSGDEDGNWIYKIVKPRDQWTTFYYGCIRAFVMTLPIYLAFLVCGENKWYILLTIPFFYLSYRLGYFISKKNSVTMGEIIWGPILWAVCAI